MLAFPPVLGYSILDSSTQLLSNSDAIVIKLTEKPCDSALDSLLLSYHAVCSLTCENGGAVNSGTCTCDCADGFSGATCGSKYTAWGANTDRSDSV